MSSCLASCFFRLHSKRRLLFTLSRTAHHCLCSYMAFSSLVRRHCLTSPPLPGGDKLHALQEKKVVRLKVLYRTLCSAHAHCRTFCSVAKVLIFVLSTLSAGERVNDTVGGIWARTRISPILKIYPKHPSKFFTILTFSSPRCDL